MLIPTNRTIVGGWKFTQERELDRVRPKKTIFHVANNTSKNNSKL